MEKTRSKEFVPFQIARESFAFQRLLLGVCLCVYVRVFVSVCVCKCVLVCVCVCVCDQEREVLREIFAKSGQRLFSLKGVSLRRMATEISICTFQKLHLCVCVYVYERKSVCMCVCV